MKNVKFKVKKSRPLRICYIFVKNVKNLLILVKTILDNYEYSGGR